MTDQIKGKHSGKALPLDDSYSNYKQYLHSIFGKATAEYFLSPSSHPQNTPVWYTDMRDNMRDHVSMEAMWDALRQRSAQILKEMDHKHSQQVIKLSADLEGLKRQDHLLHLTGIRMMFHLAQRNQAYTMYLLHNRPREK